MIYKDVLEPWTTLLLKVVSQSWYFNFSCKVVNLHPAYSHHVWTPSGSWTDSTRNFKNGAKNFSQFFTTWSEYGWMLVRGSAWRGAWATRAATHRHWSEPQENGLSSRRFQAICGRAIWLELLSLTSRDHHLGEPAWATSVDIGTTFFIYTSNDMNVYALFRLALMLSNTRTDKSILSYSKTSRIPSI